MSDHTPWDPSLSGSDEPYPENARPVTPLSPLNRWRDDDDYRPVMGTEELEERYLAIIARQQDACERDDNRPCFDETNLENLFSGHAPRADMGTQLLALFSDPGDLEEARLGELEGLSDDGDEEEEGDLGGHEWGDEEEEEEEGGERGGESGADEDDDDGDDDLSNDGDHNDDTSSTNNTYVYYYTSDEEEGNSEDNLSFLENSFSEEEESEEEEPEEEEPEEAESGEERPEESGSPVEKQQEGEEGGGGEEEEEEAGPFSGYYGPDFDPWASPERSRPSSPAPLDSPLPSSSSSPKIPRFATIDEVDVLEFEPPMTLDQARRTKTPYLMTSPRGCVKIREDFRSGYIPPPRRHERPWWEKAKLVTEPPHLGMLELVGGAEEIKRKLRFIPNGQEIFDRIMEYYDFAMHWRVELADALMLAHRQIRHDTLQIEGYEKFFKELNRDHDDDMMQYVLAQTLRENRVLRNKIDLLKHNVDPDTDEFLEPREKKETTPRQPKGGPLLDAGLWVSAGVSTGFQPQAEDDSWGSFHKAGASTSIADADPNKQKAYQTDSSSSEDSDGWQYPPEPEWTYVDQSKFPPLPPEDDRVHGPEDHAAWDACFPPPENHIPKPEDRWKDHLRPDLLKPSTGMKKGELRRMYDLVQQEYINARKLVADLEEEYWGNLGEANNLRDTLALLRAGGPPAFYVDDDNDNADDMHPDFTINAVTAREADEQVRALSSRVQRAELYSEELEAKVKELEEARGKLEKDLSLNQETINNMEAEQARLEELIRDQDHELEVMAVRGSRPIGPMYREFLGGLRQNIGMQAGKIDSDMVKKYVDDFEGELIEMREKTPFDPAFAKTHLQVAEALQRIGFVKQLVHYLLDQLEKKEALLMVQSDKVSDLLDRNRHLNADQVGLAHDVTALTRKTAEYKRQLKLLGQYKDVSEALSKRVAEFEETDTVQKERLAELQQMAARLPPDAVVALTDAQLQRLLAFLPTVHEYYDKSPSGSLGEAVAAARAIVPRASPAFNDMLIHLVRAFADLSLREERSQTEIENMDNRMRSLDMREATLGRDKETLLNEQRWLNEEMEEVKKVAKAREAEFNEAAQQMRRTQEEVIEMLKEKAKELEEQIAETQRIRAELEAAKEAEKKELAYQIAEMQRVREGLEALLKAEKPEAASRLEAAMTAEKQEVITRLEARQKQADEDVENLRRELTVATENNTETARIHRENSERLELQRAQEREHIETWVRRRKEIDAKKHEIFLRERELASEVAELKSLRLKMRARIQRLRLDRAALATDLAKAVDQKKRLAERLQIDAGRVNAKESAEELKTLRDRLEREMHPSQACFCSLLKFFLPNVYRTVTCESPHPAPKAEPSPPIHDALGQPFGRRPHMLWEELTRAESETLTPPEPAPQTPPPMAHGHDHTLLQDFYPYICQLLTSTIWLILLLMLHLRSLTTVFYLTLFTILGVPLYFLRLLGHYLRTSYRRIRPSLPTFLRNILPLAPAYRPVPEFWFFASLPSPGLLVGMAVTSCFAMSLLAAQAVSVERKIWLGRNGWRGAYMKCLTEEAPYPGWWPVEVDFRLAVEPLLDLLVSLAHEVLFVGKGGGWGGGAVRWSREME